MKSNLNRVASLLTDPQRPVMRVTLFGAAGGFLAVLSGMVLGELKDSWLFVLLPYIALGAGAAFIAVFVLLGIKTEDVWRCCGIALLAGFFWQPVFVAAKEYLLSQPERVAEAETASSTRKLNGLLTELEKSPTNTALIRQTGRVAESLTAETANLRDSSVKTRAELSVSRTLDVLTDQADQGHGVAMEAVADVAETAVAVRSRPVSQKAVTQLRRIPRTVNPTFEAKRTNVITSLKRLELSP